MSAYFIKLRAVSQTEDVDEAWSQEQKMNQFQNLPNNRKSLNIVSAVYAGTSQSDVSLMFTSDTELVNVSKITFTCFKLMSHERASCGHLMANCCKMFRCWSRNMPLQDQNSQRVLHFNAPLISVYVFTLHWFSSSQSAFRPQRW